MTNADIARGLQAYGKSSCNAEITWTAGACFLIMYHRLEVKATGATWHHTSAHTSMPKPIALSVHISYRGMADTSIVRMQQSIIVFAGMTVTEYS